LYDWNDRVCKSRVDAISMLEAARKRLRTL
jgi:hypothetical protein